MSDVIDAKTLPVGTVVATRREAFFKEEMDLGLGQENWNGTRGGKWCDYEINELIRGEVLVDLLGFARVLRVGTDEPGR